MTDVWTGIVCSFTAPAPMVNAPHRRWSTATARTVDTNQPLRRPQPQRRHQQRSQPRPRYHQLNHPHRSTNWPLEKGESCNMLWYTKVLNQQVPWSAQHLFPGGEFYLRDDGAPCHRTKAAKAFVNAQRWKTLDWPPQLPYLNHIENLWALLLKKLWTTNFKTTNELKGRIISVWHHNRDPELLNKLAMSMPDPLRAVINARGGATEYWSSVTDCYTWTDYVPKCKHVLVLYQY